MLGVSSVYRIGSVFLPPSHPPPPPRDNYFLPLCSLSIFASIEVGVEQIGTTIIKSVLPNLILFRA
jgi:hypothetical protein